MSATATASAAWTVVRCPLHPRRVLGELQGQDAKLRKDCPDCPPGARRWCYDMRTGQIRLERSHPVDDGVTTAVH